MESGSNEQDPEFFEICYLEVLELVVVALHQDFNSGLSTGGQDFNDPAGVIKQDMVEGIEIWHGFSGKRILHMVWCFRSSRLKICWTDSAAGCQDKHKEQEQDTEYH